jgi:hypothetical protein
VRGQWFSPGTPVSSKNKTDCHHDIAEILLEVALSTINQPTNQTHPPSYYNLIFFKRSNISNFLTKKK